MESFTDTTGRAWPLPINGFTIDRVREELGVDLYAYGMQADDEDPRHVLQFRVRADPVFLVRLLYSICRRQAEAAGIDFEQFAEAMVGDHLWNSIRALEAALVGFTPSPDLRAARAAAIGKAAAMLDKTLTFARQQTEKLTQDPRLDAQHSSALQKLAAQCGNMLDSLGPDTPAPTPTDN